MYKNKHILIAGDSFSSESLSAEHGWPMLLRQDFQITNVSSPGIGEYKILQNLQSENLSKYDLVLISHTSPNRLHCVNNPLYPHDHLYNKSDIIFTDAESRVNKQPIAQSIVDYYKYIFDIDYYEFIHRCCCKEIEQLTNNVPVLNITHFDWTDLYQFSNLTNFHEFWLANRGEFVHYTKEANQIIYQQLQNKIQKILT
jgi:hypothetical protein